MRDQLRTLAAAAAGADDCGRAANEGSYSSYLEVTTAQEKLFDAQLAAIQGQVDVLNGTAALYKSLGGGWPAVPAEVRDAGLGGNARPVMR
ncbi:hypothetical protein [Cupriavidus sp. UME77]|uniref:hypothetical protein n=1 Tax=Cupriavidus sp. UME77 TaxID=1862321 RepID=UPI001D26C53C|nr:hypothetical protein [Cupriavidus sp. UME77]MBB1632880.1 hypothetical protein [Cupriavidus sp. UME77]